MAATQVAAVLSTQDYKGENMNKEIAKQWTDALRSGEYTQGSGALKWDGEYCCLGVLCDLAAQAGLVKEVFIDEEIGQIGYTGPTDKFAEGGVLPVDVQSWAGMNTNRGNFNGWVASEGAADSLVDANDRLHYSFDKIADLIDANVENL